MNIMRHANNRGNAATILLHYEVYRTWGVVVFCALALVVLGFLLKLFIYFSPLMSGFLLPHKLRLAFTVVELMN